LRGPLVSLLVIGLASAMLATGMAHFVDTELSEGNIFEAGTLDLRVNGKEDPFLLFTITNVKPTKTYDVEIELQNCGTIDGIAYLHPKDSVNYEDEPGAGVASSEAELVAEEGGLVGQIIIPPEAAMGVDYCEMEEHTTLTIYKVVEDVLVPIESCKVREHECQEIELGLLRAGETMKIVLEFHLQQIPGPHMDYDGDGVVCDEDDNKMIWWKTNSLQGDRFELAFLFELIQTDPQ